MRVENPSFSMVLGFIVYTFSHPRRKDQTLGGQKDNLKPLFRYLPHGKCYFYNKVLQHFENYVVLEATTIPTPLPSFPVSPLPYSSEQVQIQKKIRPSYSLEQPSSPEATIIVIATAVGARVARVRWIHQASSPIVVAPTANPLCLGPWSKDGSFGHLDWWVWLITQTFDMGCDLKSVAVVNSKQLQVTSVLNVDDVARVYYFGNASKQ
ncbi:uncharacterized protein LOC130792003 isoform X2 [Actinidia eriantha]|uniref:uncharacterized protein LOC130792003 isoform X2 n=1 Tax=Actinidia eriantha TaxID=165200 RepID=UPI00258775B9|nr:uncharacterized protein LOC130792003 isoform X2 [Actinidia eriantha]